MKYILILSVVLLMGCSPEPISYQLPECSKGYQPYYHSTYNNITFKCVPPREVSE